MDNIRKSKDFRKEILGLLIDLKKSDPGVLPDISDIASYLEVEIDLVDHQIHILSGLGAIKANRTLDGNASPFLLDYGYLLYEKLIEEIDESPIFIHSNDYRTVTWEGETFTFNKTQALCIHLLHSSFSNGIPWVSNGEISNLLSEHSIIDTRMSKIFQKHRAWNSLIIFGGRSNPFYRLNISS